MINADQMAEEWLSPLLCKRRKLKTVLKEMEPFALSPEEVPFIIRLIENPKYDIGLFGGATTLGTHDCLHVLLGRGLLPKDEAFVIGYTMGSTKNLSRWRKNLFLFFTKYLYPEGYKFKEEERFVFNMGAMAGSLCSTDLSGVNFDAFTNNTLFSLRKELNIDVNLLRYCYEVEKRVFKDSKESQRLLN